jgi:hypothetical protein
LTVSMRLPVTGSTRMQYLASAPAAGAGVPGAGLKLAADSGEATAIMLKAAANFRCAIQFLLE